MSGIVRLGLGAATIAAIAGTAVWMSAQRTPSKMPPEIPIEDPAVAEAVARVRSIVVGQLGDGAAWGKLGQTLLANGILRPARECFAEAGRLDPNDPRWPYLEGVSLLLSDPQAGQSCWQRAAECPGDNLANRTARLRWAESLLQTNQPAQAESIFNSVLKREPDNSRARMGLGLAEDAQGRTASAIECFRFCVEHPSARQKATSRLAALALQSGNAALAADYARRIEDLPPDQPWPDPILEETLPFAVGQNSLFTQAEQQQQQGNSRNAALLLQRIIAEYPHDGRAYVKLGMILAEGGNYAGAEDVLRKGLRENPDMVQGRYFLTVALFHQAERSGFETATGKEKLVAAQAAAERTLLLKPDHGFAHLYRGLALRRLGNAAEGLKALREAVRCTPESVDPHLHLGEALATDGLRAEAVRELEIAVRLAGPNDRRPKLALDRVKNRKS